MVTPDAKREAVVHARGYHGLSERQACELMGIARRVVRYQPSRADDAGLRQRLRELAAERRRFGYGGWAICWRGRACGRTIRSC